MLVFFCFFSFQFKASGKHQPKPQKLNKFNFRVNELSRIFQHVRSGKQFVETWKKNIQPYLSNVSGIYKPSATLDENPRKDLQSTSSDEEIHEPRAKKRRANCDSYDEMSTDNIIAKKYIGESVAD